jgi:hypothetical protein
MNELIRHTHTHHLVVGRTMSHSPCPYYFERLCSTPTHKIIIKIIRIIIIINFIKKT